MDCLNLYLAVGLNLPTTLFIKIDDLKLQENYRSESEMAVD